MRQKLQTAYRQPTDHAAKARLMKIHRELARENPSAAASLEEGLEETLTLHRLGVADALGLSFSTTNVLESINAQLGRLTRQFRDGDPAIRNTAEWPVRCWPSNPGCDASKATDI